jgi:hypothetical protein
MLFRRDAVAYLIAEDQKEDAKSLLAEALECCPTSLLLHFYAAELAEENKDLDSAKKYFESLISRLQQKIDRLQPIVTELSGDLTQADLEQQKKLEKAGSASVMSHAMNAESGEEDNAQNDDQGISEADVQVKRQEYETKKAALSDAMDKANLTWIQYMKFCRRADGIKGARQVML